MNLGQPVGEMEITPAELNAADLTDALTLGDEVVMPAPIPEPEPVA